MRSRGDIATSAAADALSIGATGMLHPVRDSHLPTPVWLDAPANRGEVTGAAPRPKRRLFSRTPPRSGRRQPRPDPAPGAPPTAIAMHTRRGRRASLHAVTWPYGDDRRSGPSIAVLREIPPSNTLAPFSSLSHPLPRSPADPTCERVECAKSGTAHRASRETCATGRRVPSCHMCVQLESHAGAHGARRRDPPRVGPERAFPSATATRRERNPPGDGPWSPSRGIVGVSRETSD